MQPTYTKYKNIGKAALGAVRNMIANAISNIKIPSRIVGFPRLHLVLVSSLLVALSALLLLPSHTVEAKRHQQPLTLPAISQTDTPPESTTASATTAVKKPPTKPAKTSSWHHEKALPGDNLSLIFQRAGLSDTKLFAFMGQTPESKVLQKIHPGETLSFEIDHEGRLQKLRYEQDRLNSTLFERHKDGFRTKVIQRKPDIITAYREANITHSLFLSAQRVQMDASLIMELATIFGWDIDFALDIRENDSFKVIFEEKFLDGKKIANGNILAAEFTNQGKTFRAVRFTDSDGFSHYYTPEGNTMRKAFLRTPIDFARISSHFNLSRRHPVLNTIRAHKGTDYAAPTGTPIKAAGNGKVILAGRKGGYGNTVIIQHGSTYQTLYAHLHKYGNGIKSGSRVKQGQVIGYVGSTGLATGPHLHYEFYVNGAVRNPVTVELPKALPIDKSERQRFLAQAAPLLASLDDFQKQSTQLAQARR